MNESSGNLFLFIHFGEAARRVIVAKELFDMEEMRQDEENLTIFRSDNIFYSREEDMYIARLIYSTSRKSRSEYKYNSCLGPFVDLFSLLPLSSIIHNARHNVRVPAEFKKNLKQQRDQLKALDDMYIEISPKDYQAANNDELGGICGSFRKLEVD